MVEVLSYFTDAGHKITRELLEDGSGIITRRQKMYLLSIFNLTDLNCDQLNCREH